MTRENPIQQALRFGQSIWCDFLSRDLIRSGELDRMIGMGIRGVTTNPSIFEKAIGQTEDYDGDILAHVREGWGREEIYTALTVSDVQAGADHLLPVHEESGGEDGYVSLEVNPAIAHDYEATVREAMQLAELVSRKNAMIKIPATPAGVRAIRVCTAQGLSINATLIFSRQQYQDVAEAYIEGLEKRAAQGQNLSGIASVASLFVSRIDTAVDPLLQERGAPELMGHIAVDNARSAYRDFEELFSSGRWKALEARGAKVQRTLWASTGTKNPKYSPTLYVDSLIGPHTVNTIPPATMEAFLASGTVSNAVVKDRQGMEKRLAKLEELGISLDGITSILLADGLKAFEKSYYSLLESIERKGKALTERHTERQDG